MGLRGQCHVEVVPHFPPSPGSSSQGAEAKDTGPWNRVQLEACWACAQLSLQAVGH